MQRFKTFDGTGVAPNGRLYPVDLNNMQDLVAAQHDLSQAIGAGQYSIGEDALALVRYGSGIARLIGGLRVDNLLSANGFQPTNLTQAQRDAIAAGLAPKGTAVFNTDKNRWEYNTGTDGARVWDAFGTNVSTGWIDSSDEQWSYVSYAAPVGIINITGDKTTKYSTGMKLKLTQSASIRYGIIHGVGAYGAGVTPLTVYFGTDYALLNATISSPAYTFGRAPYGFPCARGKWTIRVTNSAVNQRSSPVNGTWYNQGSNTITLPVGTWRLSFWVDVDANLTGTTSADLYLALSTTASSGLDKELIDGMALGSMSNTMRKLMSRSKELVISNPTTYYVNAMVSQGSGQANTLTIRGDDRTIVLEAESAYI
jgi:hypothetical protein